jgi:flavin reductase (DIM6/NTAB) family NADH-FMN oxidoreductase RutF
MILGDDGGMAEDVAGTRVERSIAEIGRLAYPLLNCLVAPRPIAWVSTVDGDGRVNLAPHSYFTVSSAEPPVVQFTSLGRKDSLRNVEANGEFVVNLAPWRLRAAVNLTSVDAPPEVDELALAGLDPEPSRVVRPPRVAQSPAALECRLLEVRSFGTSPRAGHVVFGEVVHVAVDAAVLAADGLPDLLLLDSAARADRGHWVRLGPLETIERPRWADRSAGAGPGPSAERPGTPRR